MNFLQYLKLQTDRALTRAQKRNAVPSEDDAAGEQEDTEGQVDLPPEPPKAEVPKTQDETQTSGAQTKRPKRPRWANQRWQTVFTGLILLVTTAYVVVSYFQWQTTKDSLRTSHRAYLVVAEIKVDFESKRMNVALANVGHVPVDGVAVDVIVERLGDYKIYGLGYYTGGGVDIPPGTYKAVAAVSLEDLTPEITDRIRKGKEILQVACFLKYDDGFGNPQEHILNYRYLPPPNEGWESLPLLSEGEREKQGAQRWKRAEPDSSPSPFVLPSPN